MPRGASDIPILRLEVLQHYFETFMTPPNLILSNLFPSSPSPSSTIKWESSRGGRDMTPFVPPGAPAPLTAPFGVAEHIAEAAYWKEKMYYDEEFLNNLRQPGAPTTYLSATARLGRDLAALKNRSNRRKEWMFTKMLFDNGFTYDVKQGYKVTLDYGIPSDHRITLGSSYYWSNGGSKVPMSDITAGKIKINEDCGGMVDYAICNSTVLNYLANDTTIRQILQRDYFGGAFGDGSLYRRPVHELIGVNSKVIGSLLDIPNFIVYDEMYEVRRWLTGAVTGGATTHVSVDDTSDLEAGAKVRFWDVSAGTYEDCYIFAVHTEAGTIQLSAPPAASYKSGEDYITMAKKFVPDDKFIMMASRVDGQPIAEYKQAPFGLGRHYGQYTDRKDEWDPEGTYIRVQDKGLPILYNRDAIYTIDVVVTTGQAKTTTTTTTTSSSSTTTTA